MKRNLDVIANDSVRLQVMSSKKTKRVIVSIDGPRIYKIRANDGGYELEAKAYPQPEE